MRRSVAGLASFVLLLAGLMLGVSLGVFADCTCVDDDCYEDIVVTKAGIDASRGTYSYVGMTNGKPEYQNRQDVRIRYISSRLRWIIESSTEEYYESRITSSGTPPTSGWTEAEWGDIPLPRLSGGENCGPPELTEVTLRAWGPSGCCGPSWTAVGAEVRLEFTASTPLANTPVVTVMGHAVTPTGNIGGVMLEAGTVWEASYFLTEDDPEGLVSFTIDYQSTSGVPGPQVTTTTSDEWYYFDKTPPSAPSLVSPADGSVVTSSLVSFEWTESTDNASDMVFYHLYVAGFHVSLGSQTGPWSRSGLPEGTHTWYMTAMDRARNESLHSQVRTFTIDVPDGQLLITNDWTAPPRVNEGGEDCYQFEIALSSPPAANVDITVALDPQLRTADGQPGEDLVIQFTPTAWGPETVCVYAADDALSEGLQVSYAVVTTSSTDPDYDGQSESVYISILDNDPAVVGIVVLPAGVSGGFLDNEFPGGPPNPSTVGGYAIEAVVTAGDEITGALTITDIFGRTLSSTLFSVPIYGLAIVDGQNELTYAGFGEISYNWDTETSHFSIETGDLDPGYYIIQLHFQDQSERDICIQVVAP